MIKRFRTALNSAAATGRSLRKDDKGVVMVEWVALAGVFVAVLIGTFLLIGDKANTVVGTVDTNLGQITADIGGGGGGGTAT